MRIYCECAFQAALAMVTLGLRYERLFSLSFSETNMEVKKYHTFK